MSESNEMERVRAAIARVMARKGLKPKPLSKAAGLGETAIRDILLPDSGDIKFSTLNKLAGVMEVDIEELVGSAAMPIAGRIGAGGTIIFMDLPADELVPRPPSVGGKLEALEVEGDSMLPMYRSGDVLYISRTHDGVLEDYIGEVCAVRLNSGETYVKQLARGSRPGFFSLRSLNAADIEDVELEWATPIVFSLTRFARKALGF